MAVDVRHGLLGDGRIRADGRRSRVTRDTGGWYVVRDTPLRGDARVLYRDLQDLGVIRWRDAILRVPFVKGLGRFSWEGREYLIGSMIEGEIRVRQADRLVAHGHVTVAGLHLDSVEAELAPLLRPLAWILVLRSEALRRTGRYEPPVVDPGVPIP